MPDAERRLAAIVAIDVAGYSRLMGLDEQGTLAALKAHRAATTPIGERHGGRMVGTAGDGILLEFPSVTAAVIAAVEVQTMMAERNADLPDDAKMLYRVGINLGDVMVDGHDIYGDGVNVAARLEALAKPGGICVSRTVRDNVRDRMTIAFEDLGAIEVKNIARPVRAFRVMSDAGVEVKKREITPADPSKMAYQLPEKPSIAVLPFDNLSGDPTQDYLGDGLTENIIAVLASSPLLFVIARNSSFTYKGTAVRVQEVAEQMGVRYVLEGSVQRAGDMLRITAQLVDAVDGRHLWAERYDRELKDLFALQDEIARQILVAMQVNLTLGELAKRVSEAFEDPRSFELITQQGSAWEKWTPSGNQESERLVTELLAREPKSARATATMGAVLWQKAALGISRDPGKDMAIARAYAEKAIELDDQMEQGHFLLGAFQMFAGEHEAALASGDRAVELAPNVGYALAVSGWIKTCCGQPREATALLKQAMRIEPYHPNWVPAVLSRAHIILGQYAEAKAICNGLLSGDLHHQGVGLQALGGLTVVAVFEKDMAAASKHMAHLRDAWPDGSVSKVRMQNAWHKDQAFMERYLDALKTAGLPED